MLAGAVLPTVAPYLASGRLHAAKKKDRGVRPIAVGNLLRRLVSKAVVEKAAGLLSPLQVGVPGGYEAIIHAVRHIIQEQEQLFILQADLINAYNLVDRQAMLAQVKEHFPELLPWVSTC